MNWSRTCYNARIAHSDAVYWLISCTGRHSSAHAHIHPTLLSVDDSVYHSPAPPRSGASSRLPLASSAAVLGEGSHRVAPGAREATSRQTTNRAHRRCSGRVASLPGAQSPITEVQTAYNPDHFLSVQDLAEHTRSQSDNPALRWLKDQGMQSGQGNSPPSPSNNFI